MSIHSEEIVVDVDGETVKHTVFVDPDTGFDVDGTSGQFRTREESIALVQEVYRIGRDNLKSDLVRYNKWISGNHNKREDLLFRRPTVPSRGKQPVDVTIGLSSDEKRFSAVRCKNQGNDALMSGKYRKAIRKYSEGLVFDPTNATLFANRAEAYRRLSEYEKAANDAIRSIDIDPSIEKAHFRLFVALMKMRQFDEAFTVASRVLEMGTAGSLQTFTESLWECHLKEVEAAPFVMLDEDGSIIVLRGCPVGKTVLSLPCFEMPLSSSFTKLVREFTKHPNFRTFVEGEGISVSNDAIAAVLDDVPQSDVDVEPEMFSTAAILSDGFISYDSIGKVLVVPGLQRFLDAPGKKSIKTCVDLTEGKVSLVAVDPLQQGTHVGVLLVASGSFSIPAFNEEIKPSREDICGIL